MRIPFTIEQFFRVFAEYNSALWPAQVFLIALALGAITLIFVPNRWSGVGVSAILAFLWAWLALAYHLAFFTAINPLAYAFSGISIAGALIFIWHGVIHRRLQFKWASGTRSVIGAVLILFALIAYPAWSHYVGHRYPAFPTFGLPCPTTIFTIGVLAFLVAPYPRSPFVVPVLWCFVGAQAAVLFGVLQDLGLVVAGLVGIALLVRSSVASVRAGTPP